MFPKDVSAHGGVVDDLFWYATYLVIGTFALILVILFYSLIKFRDRPGHRAKYVRGDSKQTVILTLIFASAVFVFLDLNLAYFDHHAFKELLGDPPMGDDAFVVDVHAQQYQWNFRYPGADGVFGESQDDLVDKESNFFGLDRVNDEAAADDLESIAVVAIPVNTPVLFRISSNDVLHSFFPVNFRVKMDALPGTTTWVYLEATETGTFEIACAELCGLNHFTMRAELQVMEQADYEAFIAELAEWLEEDGGDDY